jgi:hypothetical protein
MTFPLNYGLSKTGLPLIVVKIFDHDICLLLDTGSNQNIIDERIYKHFRDKLPETDQSKEVLTFNGTTGGAEIMLPFVFENQQYNEPFVSSNTEAFDAVESETGIRIYGILGNHFFLKHGWILDFDKIEVYKQ